MMEKVTLRSPFLHEMRSNCLCHMITLYLEWLQLLFMKHLPETWCTLVCMNIENKLFFSTFIFQVSLWVKTTRRVVVGLKVCLLHSSLFNLFCSLCCVRGKVPRRHTGFLKAGLVNLSWQQSTPWQPVSGRTPGALPWKGENRPDFKGVSKQEVSAPSPDRSFQCLKQTTLWLILATPPQLGLSKLEVLVEHGNGFLGFIFTC